MLVNQNIVIEITASAVSRSGNGASGPWEIFTQEAYYHSPVEKYPQKIAFPVESMQKSYPQGFYLLNTAKSLSIGQYQQLGISRFMQLIPLSESELSQIQKDLEKQVNVA